MKYSFAETAQNLMTRKFGGTTIGVADPYITGTHFIWFDILPTKLVNFTRTGVSGISDIGDIQKILSATCTSVTAPGGTLQKIEFPGLGGIKWGVPGGIDYVNSFSCKFFEMNKTPILDIFHGWIKLIRDYRLGIAETLQDGEEGSGFSNSTYAGRMYYWTTAPDGYTVEYYACYDGIWPTKDPQDLFSSDIESIGKLDIEIEFHVDVTYHEQWVKEKCDTFHAAIYNTRNRPGSISF